MRFLNAVEGFKTIDGMWGHESSRYWLGYHTMSSYGVWSLLPTDDAERQDAGLRLYKVCSGSCHQVWGIRVVLDFATVMM